jgi:hypothetical protein
MEDCLGIINPIFNTFRRNYTKLWDQIQLIQTLLHAY